MATPSAPPFRNRSHEISRIEGLSDAVFGFAVTLLVVSLEVPRDFTQLAAVMRGFLPFATSFAILVWIWYTQHVFFRRYGLQDPWTIALNAVLLFVVLFYIYPLKFLFAMVIDQMSGTGSLIRLADGSNALAVRDEGAWRTVITIDQMPTLMVIYSLGFIAMWTMFALMHWHAWRQRDALALNAVERFDTRTSIREDLILIGIGALGVALSRLPDEWMQLSGWVYGLIGPVMGVHGYFSGKGREAIETPLSTPLPERSEGPAIVPAGNHPMLD